MSRTPIPKVYGYLVDCKYCFGAKRRFLKCRCVVQTSVLKRRCVVQTSVLKRRCVVQTSFLGRRQLKRFAAKVILLRKFQLHLFRIESVSAQWTSNFYKEIDGC